MAVAFDQAFNITHIYRASSGVFTKITNTGGATTFDCFSDTAQVNDALYFGWEYGVWHDLTINLYAPVTGTEIVGVWEYYTTAGTWVSLTCNDSSSGLTVSGSHTITFDVPDNWTVLYRLDGSDSRSTACYIRYRLTTVTEQSDCGAINSNPTGKDYTLEVTGTTQTGIASLVAVAGTHITNIGSYYYIDANLRIGAGTATAGNLVLKDYIQVEVGGPTKYRTIAMPNASSTLQIGDIAGSNYNGNTYLKWHNHESMYMAAATGYHTWFGTLKIYNSTLAKRAGGFVNPQVGCAATIINSQLTVFGTGQRHWFFNYSNSLNFNNVIFDTGYYGFPYLYATGTFSNLILANCQKIVFGNTGQMSLQKTVIPSGVTVNVSNPNTQLNMIDCAFQGTGFVGQTELGDSGNVIREQYTTLVSLQHYRMNTEIPGHLTITDGLGQVVHSDYIYDVSLALTVMQRSRNSSGTITNINYNPFTFVVSAPGFKPLRVTATVSLANKAFIFPMTPLDKIQEL